MRARSRRAIRERFSMETCIKVYEALYARCARENGVRDGVRERPCLRRSAEGLLGETVMAVQAKLDIEALLAPWLDTLASPLTPMNEPGDAYWLTCRAMLLSLFESIAQAGYAPLAATLNDLGVSHFDQIAGWSDADIDRIDAQLGRFQGRIRRDDWVGQARLLSAGDEAAFQAKFGAV